MSVSMFYVSPQTNAQKSFNIPVCTEDVFRRVIRPAADRVGARIVPLFEVGFELSSQDAAVVVGELLDVTKQLQADTSEEAAYALPRLIRLSEEIGEIFKMHPEAVLYIG